MNSIASRKLGELGEWWLDWGHRWRSRGLDRSSLRCYPGTGCRHRPARTARPHNRGPPICAPAASLLSPAISRNARFADCSANNVGVTARFVTNPELTDDTDVTRWVLVPRVTYWPALFTLRPVRYSKCSSPDLSSGLMAGAGRRLAPFVTAILASGYDSSPGVGPGGRGFHWSRGCPSWVAGAVHAGQGPCGSASMRCHAAVIASAHGHVAWIFRRRRRPPRTRRAAA